MTLKEILSENTDEILAIIIVAPTIIVLSYQAIIGSEITMPTVLAGIIVGYYFGKRKTEE